jgi:hypothetical protein
LWPPLVEKKEKIAAAPLLAFASSIHNKQPYNILSLAPALSIHNKQLPLALAFSHNNKISSRTLVSDFHLVSLRTYMEELSASFNAQDQAPDDLHTQDQQCDPCIFVRKFSPLPTRTCKVTHEEGRLTPFPSTSVTRQDTGTLFTVFIVLSLEVPGLLR